MITNRVVLEVEGARRSRSADPSDEAPVTTMTWALRLVAVVGICLSVARPVVAASSGTQVVFTIDVESNGTVALPDQLDAVCTDGSACGLSEITRLLTERHWAGTFFLDVYEHRQWGEKVMRNIAVRLQQGGQDVELHTHPQWAYDSARWGMDQYSLEEQTAIVRDGARLLQAWTGRPVVAHRAGAYAADANTLVALARNGILVDSSVFWQHPNTRLDVMGFPRNLPESRGGLLQIPVTVYEREDRPAWLGTWLAPVRSIRKIDPNWFVDAAEGRAAMDAVLRADVPVLVVFLHSFSFVAERSGSGPPTADRHAMDMFRLILDEVARRDLHVVTMRDLAERGGARASSPTDVVPSVTVPIRLDRYVWHRLKPLNRRMVGIAAVVAVLLTAAGVFFVFRRQKSSDGQPVAGRLSDVASPASRGAASR